MSTSMITKFIRKFYMFQMKVFIILSICISSVYLDDEPHLLWQNNDFPEKNPLEHFHPLEKGYYNAGSLTSGPDPAGVSLHPVLKIFYEKGSYSSIRGYKGAQFYSRPISAHDSMLLTYDLYFSPGFDFVRGGKLPGLSGGVESQCSGGRHNTSCFSARLMWRREGEGEIYAYVPRDNQRPGFCERSDVVCSPVKGVSLGRGTFKFNTGVWHKVTEYVHLNTIGEYDGEIKIWFDDKLVYEGGDFMWRTNSTLHITAIFFSTFFGGSTTEWAATDHCFSYFRNFILSSGSRPPTTIY